MAQGSIQIVRQQAERLGGGWRMEHGIMPVVVLTTVEAENVIQRLEHCPLAVKHTAPDGTETMFDPDEISYIFSTDGV